MACILKKSWILTNWNIIHKNFAPSKQSNKKLWFGEVTPVAVKFCPLDFTAKIHKTLIKIYVMWRKTKYAYCYWNVVGDYRMPNEMMFYEGKRERTLLLNIHTTIGLDYFFNYFFILFFYLLLLSYSQPVWTLNNYLINLLKNKVQTIDSQ